MKGSLECPRLLLIFASSFRPHLPPLALTPGSTGQSLEGRGGGAVILPQTELIGSFAFTPDPLSSLSFSRTCPGNPVLRLRLFFSSVASLPPLCFVSSSHLALRCSMILSLPCKDSRGVPSPFWSSLLVAPPAPPVSPFLFCAEREQMRAK